MSYIEKVKKGKRYYFYLSTTLRIKNKFKKIRVYLGKDINNKKLINLKKNNENFLKNKVEEIKKVDDINKEFLDGTQIDRLENIKKEFNNKLRLDDKLIEDMFRDFKTYYIYNTNAIEGNSLTLKETGLLLNENKTPSGKDLREIHDHINEKETFDFILKNKSRINSNLIIKLHSALLKNIDNRIGSYRVHNVRVFGAEFEPAHAEYVKADMEILLSWYNKNKNKIHPIILSAIFHEKFERIHPFYDGNGRTGRMLSNLILIQNNFPPLIIENKKRKKYYEALDKGHKAGLTNTDIILYKPIVDFFYEEILYTFGKVFDKWG